jgi:serine protease Do
MGIGEVGELLRRSTVYIHSSGRRAQSAGSGVIWDSEGTVITNSHVLGTGEHLVQLWDGRSFRADVKARDDVRDLAKLKLPATGLPAATFRKHAMRPGELVVAVGNPMGFTGALTTGIVHAAGPFPGLGHRPWVQAAIRLAPGNSGGPLADAAGHVAGINTMNVSGGIALAIPSAIVEEFVHNGATPRLGVTVRPVRLDQGALGLLLLNVEPNSPTAQASLLIGDVLIDFTTAADLADSIGRAGSGGLKLRFLRGDLARDREVVLSLASRFTREAA